MGKLMAEDTNKRLDRIEEKLDKMGDALINLARFEEKIISYSKYFEEKMDTYKFHNEK